MPTPGGAVGMPTKARLTGPPPGRGGEDLGQVHGAHAGAQAAQPAADVHQAGGVPGRAHLGPGRQHVAHLVGQHRRGDVWVLEREGAAEAAARLRLRQLHQVDAADRPQQPQRAVADPQHPQRVAGRVVGDPVRVVGADVGDPEHVDEQLRQLEGPRRHLLGRRRQPVVAGLPRDPGVLVAHRPRARAARHHHRLVPGERRHVAAHQRQRLAGVAGVDVHLPAAGLGHGHLDLQAQPLQ
jgi:hypothetical protein